MKIFFIWKQKSEGKPWIMMKKCHESNAQKWLNFYRKSDPLWTYVASEEKPINK